VRDADRRRVVRAEQHGQHHADRRDHERGEQRPPEAVDPEHAVRQGVGGQEDAGVRGQDQHEAEHERRGQPQRGEHGRDHRVQRRRDRGDEQRAPVPVDADAGEEPRGHHERDARGEPRDDEREQPQTGTLAVHGQPTV
jgi:hypothetical protein